MKVKVLMAFIDKLDHKTAYNVGDVIEWDDIARIKDCEGRGLVEVIEEEKPKKETKKKAKKEAPKE